MKMTVSIELPNTVSFGALGIQGYGAKLSMLSEHDCTTASAAKRKPAKLEDGM